MTIYPVRVLVVEESIIFKETILPEFAREPGIEVVATASDPLEAQDLIKTLAPDVMTFSIGKDKTKGISSLKSLLKQHHIPVLIISSATDVVFDALEVGATDFLTKPAFNTPQDIQKFVSKMAFRVRIASKAKVIVQPTKVVNYIPKNAHGTISAKDSIIAIGASTGGTEAILSILKELKDDLPGIVVVQHMPKGFTKDYAKRLNSICSLQVSEAKDKDKVLPGTVLIAPGGLQMSVERLGGGLAVKCYPGKKISGHCPSVDNLFDSIAKLKGINALGIILTGMGSDGANGLLAMKNSGAATIGQDNKTSVVYGMPAVAYSIGAVDFQLPLERIPHKIYEWRLKLINEANVGPDSNR